MQIQVTFRHMDPSEGLRQHATEKVERVQKYVRDPVDVHVTLSVVKHRHIAEVQVLASHVNVTATEETKDLYSAIDRVMDKVERQLRKHTTKVKHHKGGESTARSDVAAPLPEDDVATGESDELSPRIYTERVAVKPMAVEEAVMQLQVLESEFLVFQHETNTTLGVVYRRKDGSYGVIEPELS